MPSIINRIPVGLLSQLDMKAQGYTPPVLLDEVRGSFDLRDLYYLQQRESRVGGTNPITAPGSRTDTSGGFLATCPSNEVWWVWSFTARSDITLAGGGTLVAVPITTTDNARIQTRGPIPPFAWAAGDLPVLTGQDAGFWMKPGDAAGIRVIRYTAFTVDPSFSLELSVSRFLI